MDADDKPDSAELELERLRRQVEALERYIASTTREERAAAEAERRREVLEYVETIYPSKPKP